MAEPIPAQKAPYNVTVEEGKRYFWCACGRSAKQPFCDGSHKDTGITPMPFTAEKTEDAKSDADEGNKGGDASRGNRFDATV